MSSDALARKVRQQLEQTNITEQIAVLETEYAAKQALHFLTMLLEHRQRLPPQARIVADMAHFVAMRTVADVHVEALLSAQPGLAGLVEGVAKMVRQKVTVQSAQAPRVATPRAGS